MANLPTSSLILPNSQKLRGEENYAQWVRVIETLADKFDLHKYYHPRASDGPDRIDEFLIKTEDEKEQAKLKGKKAWIAHEAKMRQTIELSIFPGPMAVIATKKTAKGMWMELKSHYEGSGAVLEYSAIQDYVRQSISEHSTLENFINRFQKSCEKLITPEPTDVKKWHSTIFIMAVKERYPVWAERQRSNIRVNLNISLSSSIADLTDETRESSNIKSGELAMIGAGNSGKNTLQFRGKFFHCKCCGNTQARHTIEGCFEDPKNKAAKVAWEKKNKKKWVD